MQVNVPELLSPHNTPTGGSDSGSQRWRMGARTAEKRQNDSPPCGIIVEPETYRRTRTIAEPMQESI
jgi:hypothetical protein